MPLRRLCLLLIALWSLVALGQDCDSLPAPHRADSLPVSLPAASAHRLDRFTNTRLYRATHVAVPLILVGQIVKYEDAKFRTLRFNYLPEFHRHVDDYLQYSPAALMLGLKLGGAEGRSSWGRMLTSHAFAVALMTATVNGLKYTTHVTRPDGSANNSFPSGHTATAFMTATMLNREYGRRYPWLAMAGYAAATSTGVMRMANNRHWLSDVLTGAGIGILSTELGYYLADLIFRDRGLHSPCSDEVFAGHPSFLALYMGINAPLAAYNTKHNVTLQTAPGATAGLEGAYFFHHHLGVGGRFTASNVRIASQGAVDDIVAADFLTFSAGGYYSAPLSRRWLVGSKLLAGVAHYPAFSLAQVQVSHHHGLCLGTGLSLTFKSHAHYGMRFFVDYDLHPNFSPAPRHNNSWLTYGAAFTMLL